MNYLGWEIWDDCYRNESGRVRARNIYTGIELCGNSVSSVMKMIEHKTINRKK